jgi:hypothetical protein
LMLLSKHVSRRRGEPWDAYAMDGLNFAFGILECDRTRF